MNYIHDSALWIFLYCALDVYPLFPLRHVPCFDKLRFPFWKMMTIATVLMLAQGFGFVWLYSTPGVTEVMLTFYRQLAMIPFVLLTCFCVRDSLRKTLFVDFLMAPYVLIINFLSYFIGMLFFRNAYTANPIAIDVILRALIIASTYPLKYIFLKRIVKPIITIKAEGAWGYIWLMPITFTLLSFLLTRFYTFSQNFVLLTLARVLSYGGCVIISLSLLKTIHKVKEYTMLEEGIKHANMLLAMQSSQYDHILESIEQTKTARHDLRYHLHVISALVEQKKYDELQQFLEQYAATVNIENELLVCKNFAVNSIASYMISKARKQNINVNITLHLDNHICFYDTDLCIIIGNCMENAIDACMLLPESERFINANAQIIRNNLSFTIDNSFNGMIEKNGDTFMSFKRGNTVEGIGLTSVKTIVEKYNGLIDIQHENKIFMVSILLMPNNSEGRRLDENNIATAR